MNRSEFERYLIEYVENYFRENQRRHSKVIIRWLWDDFIFDNGNKRFKIIRSFKDLREFEKISDSNFTLIGIIGKNIFQTLQIQLKNHFLIDFIISRFLKILRINIKVPNKILDFFTNDYIFFSFLRNFNIEEDRIDDYYEFLLKINYGKIFYSKYEESENFKNILKIFFLFTDLRLSNDIILKEFLKEYIKTLLYQNNLKIFDKIFLKVLNDELIEEFFLILMYFINLIDKFQDKKKIFETFKEKLECEEFNQFLFLKGKYNELLQLAENFFLFLSHTKNDKIMKMAERIFRILENSKNFELNQRFQNRFSLGIYKQLIRDLMILNNNQISEISEKIVISNYHLQYEDLYNFLMISNRLYKSINKNSFSEEDILNIFEIIFKFEDNYSKLVKVNLSKIIDSDSENDFKRFYNSIDKKINEFLENIENNNYFNKGLIIERIESLMTKNVTTCIIEFTNFDYKYFNLIRNYLKYKYPFVEEKISIFSDSIDFFVDENLKIDINKDNFLFKSQELNNLSNKVFTLFLNEDISFESFKYNLLEPIFNKLLEFFSSSYIILFNKKSQDCYYYLIYSFEKTRELKIQKLRIKQYFPKKIYVNKPVYVNILLKNPNKWPITISEAKIISDNQEIIILKDLYVSSFEVFKVNFKKTYIETGSYSVVLILKCIIMDGNKIIYDKIHNLSISLVVKETPLQIQKKRKQDDFFNNYT